MAITIVTRAGKGSALNATEFDANLTNLAAAIENLTTGHDHDGTDSKSIIADYITYTPSGELDAVTVQDALDELESEKLAISATFEGTDTTPAIVTINTKTYVTDDVTINTTGFKVDVSGGYVNTGKTNSGTCVGIQGHAPISNANFKGTVSYMIGVRGISGITTCGAGCTITNAYGLHGHIHNTAADGTITNAYGAYISNAGTTGTITNRYGISIAAMAGTGTACKGIFISSLSGTQTEKYGLHVAAISGASTSNYGIYLGGVSGATNNYAIYSAGGTACFSGLLDLSPSSAGQIKFPATQNASSDANTLDDYEEGTFTPILKFGSATTGITYSVQSGYYIKIGAFVMIHLYILLTSKGSATGDADITGLPFAAINFVPVSTYMTGVSCNDNPNHVINSTTMHLREVTNAGVISSLTDADFANSSLLILSAVYKV